MQRVALLPVVLLCIIAFSRRGSGAAVGLPWFLVVFVILMAINSFGVVPAIAQSWMSDASRWLLVIAISALGVKTSLKDMFAVGPRQAAIIVGETLLLLTMAVSFVLMVM